jgi:hypothetical protein
VYRRSPNCRGRHDDPEIIIDAAGVDAARFCCERLDPRIARIRSGDRCRAARDGGRGRDQRRSQQQRKAPYCPGSSCGGGPSISEKHGTGQLSSREVGADTVGGGGIFVTTGSSRSVFIMTEAPPRGRRGNTKGTPSMWRADSM